MLRLIAPGKRKRNRHWIARGRLAGRLYEFSTRKGDKAAAERVAAAFAARALAESRQPGAAVRTFDEAIDAYIAFRKPGPDDLRRILRLASVLGGHDIGAISHADLVAAAAVLYPAAKPSSLNRNVITPASAILHYAAEAGWCPYRRIKRFKEPRPVVRAVPLRSANAMLRRARGKVRLLLLWLFHQGTRISDTLRVDWSHIDLRRRTVRVHVAKTDIWRTFPLANEVFLMLANERSRHGPLFPWPNRWAAYKALKTSLGDSGRGFTPHMARHTLGTALAQSGASLRAIMAALGHADIKSSIRYQDADLELVRQAQAGVRGFVGAGRKKRQ